MGSVGWRAGVAVIMKALRTPHADRRHPKLPWAAKILGGVVGHIEAL
jgi:hypothetical protein